MSEYKNILILFRFCLFLLLLQRWREYMIIKYCKMDTIEMCFDCLAYCIDILDIIMQLINANKQEKPVILQDNK